MVTVMPEFYCTICGKSFTLGDETLRKYPGWVPKYCREHSPKKKSSVSAAQAPRGGAASQDFESNECLTLEQVLAKYSAGPDSGIFTDGSSRPNPGPGGWGVVFVKDGKIIEQRYGHEADTTNNRMELTALTEAYKLAPVEEEVTIYTDSELCLNTLTKWAKEWERNRWRRKGGPIKNLDLVKDLYKLYSNRPKAALKWLESHQGWLWNEYADSLASAWTRDKL